MNKSKPAIFLDRDGTILNEHGYLSDPKKIFLYPTAPKALAALQKKGFCLVVITNQSGVGRGYFSLTTLARVNRAFKSRLSARGVRLDGIYFCPHRPDAGCACRKPKTLLVKKAVRDLRLDMKRSFVIGDQSRDIRLAANLGIAGVLVLTGGGRRAPRSARSLAAHVSRDLAGAARWILSRPTIK